MRRPVAAASSFAGWPQGTQAGPITELVRPEAVAVVICTYADSRFQMTVRAVQSVLEQEEGPARPIVVVDHNPSLERRLAARLPDITILANRYERGLSGGRNTALALVPRGAVAFLDDDAVAEPDWLRRLCRHLDDPNVMAAGGWTVPTWEKDAPRGLPPEMLWTVGCSYRGLPTTVADVRNVFGGNMMVRVEAFQQVAGFREGIGRAGGRPVGCEETELCIRIGQRIPGARIVFDPDARIHHFVPSDRATWRYHMSRCYAEGLSKAGITKFVGARDSLRTERAYVRQTLVRGVLRGIVEGLKGRDPAGFLRAAAIVGGVGAAASGYAVGTVSSRAPASPR